MNYALDDSISDDGHETYNLFTLDTHSVRFECVQKGKKVFGHDQIISSKICLLGKLCNWILHPQTTHLQWMISGPSVQQGLTLMA